MSDESQFSKVYLDTNVFIRAVEGTNEAGSPAKELLQFLRTRPERAVTSEITFGEVLAPPERSDAMPLHIKRRAYLDLLLWSGFISLVPVTRSILIETADLRSATRLKLPDAIHLVSAIRMRCRFFVTGDKGITALPTGMIRVSPDERGIEALLREVT